MPAYLVIRRDQERVPIRLRLAHDDPVERSLLRCAKSAIGAQYGDLAES